MNQLQDIPSNRPLGECMDMTDSQTMVNLLGGDPATGKPCIAVDGERVPGLLRYAGLSVRVPAVMAFRSDSTPAMHLCAQYMPIAGVTDCYLIVTWNPARNLL